MDKKIQWTTRTALFLAVLIIFQFISRNMGQFVTGSLVNLVLVMSGVTAGMASGLAVAVLSPFFAFFLGIGPAFPQLLPLIALGNAAIVLVTVFITDKKSGVLTDTIAILCGAAVKFLVLFVGIVKLLLPFLPALKPQQVKVLSVAFSWPQLVTALIGAAAAFLIAPAVKKALRK
ncbi:MAG: ECF transporter S component [Bacillota bacterium]|nr:ECF transporter S component [Bacillota bacterium]